MQLIASTSWEERYTDAFIETTIDMLIDCAMEVPDVLPDDVCAPGDEPDRENVREWATAIAEDEDAESMAYDVFYQADQILKARAKEEQEATA